MLSGHNLCKIITNIYEHFHVSAVVQGVSKKQLDSCFFDNYSEIPRSIALADMANEREHQS